jgi:co-chaperonin GroES (HSP10)
VAQGSQTFHAAGGRYRLLIGKGSGTEVKIEGKDILIIKESDVLGVVEKSSTQ